MANRWSGMGWGKGHNSQPKHGHLWIFISTVPPINQEVYGWRERVRFGKRKQVGENLTNVLREALGLGSK